MLRSYTFRHAAPNKRKKWRTQLLTVHEFQYRYAVFMASMGLFLALAIGGVSLYFLNHNYNLFIRAELISAPQVVDNLYRELKLANEVLVSTLIVYVVFMALVGIRFSHRIIVPVMLVQEKMRDVCRGDLKGARVRYRTTDEFQEFGETYNYLIETLIAQVKNDIARLEKIRPPSENRDAVHAWEKMIEEKLAQISADRSVLSAPAVDSRRAS